MSNYYASMSNSFRLFTSFAQTTCFYLVAIEVGNGYSIYSVFLLYVGINGSNKRMNYIFIDDYIIIIMFFNPLLKFVGFWFYSTHLSIFQIRTCFKYGVTLALFTVQYLNTMCDVEIGSRMVSIKLYQISTFFIFPENCGRLLYFFPTYTNYIFDIYL